MRPKTPRQTLALYWRATHGFRGWLSVHIFSVTVAVIAQSIAAPYLVAQGINLLPKFLETPKASFGETFQAVIWLYLGAVILSWLAWRLSGWAMIKFEIGVMADLDQRSYEHLSTMSYNFYTTAFVGSLVNQANRLARSFERLYDVFAFDILGLIIKVSFSTIILFTIQPIVALSLLGFFVLYTVCAVALAIWKMTTTAAAAAASSRQTGRLADNLSNMSAIKYFAREAHEISAYRRVVTETKRAFTRDWAIQEIIHGVQAIMLIGFSASMFVGSLYLVAHRQIDFGQFILVQSYVMVIFDALWGVGRVARNVERSLADAAEMTVILNTPPEVSDVPKAKRVRITDGAVQLRDVSFSYRDENTSHTVFSNFNLDIQPGEKIGLVGTSGGGKTTVTKLLLRLMDIQSGTILLDGHDIATMRQADVRRAISYVPQEPLLFHRSLYENIAYGRPQATLAQVKQAAVQAHATEFIDLLPKGFDTMVGERGIKLSGGQRQRVAIARAMLKDAPILVLDEATSALDSQSEKLIQQALSVLMDGRTAIVIAHRLSTIQRLDRIVVLEAGHIVEQGSHTELIARGGVYASLWSHQSGGFITDDDK